MYIFFYPLKIVIKNPPASAGDVRDVGSIPGSGRSPGGGQSTSVFLPGESHGQRNLAGYSPWGHTDSDTTETTSQQQQQQQQQQQCIDIKRV